MARKAKIRAQYKYNKRTARLEVESEVLQSVKDASVIYLEENTGYEDGSHSMVIRLDFENKK